MLETFEFTVNQILIMFLFMLIGYFIKRKNIGGDGVGTALSALEVNVFLPAVCFLSFAENFTASGISENAPFLYAGIAVIIVTFFIAKIMSSAFGENALQKDVYMYSYLIPNLGYMGYPLVEAVFGETALFKMMIFAIPFNITIYTYGMYILNPNRVWNIKKLFNPSVIAILLGILFGLFGIKLPSFLGKTVVSAKNCMSPIAMILTGFVLGSIELKPVFLSIKTYIASLIRGIVIPAVIFGIMYFLKIDKEIILVATATLAMPFGLNSVVFPEAFGGDGTTGAKICLISNIMSIITIPAVFAFLSRLL